MVLGFKETEKLLKKYKMPFVESRMIENKKAGLSFAEKFGYPIVLKIISPKILHRTEIKGAIKDIENKQELEKSYQKISKIAKKHKAKILIQKQAQGRELIIGAKTDPVFGPVVLFGMGGIFTEILKDISFKLAPIKRAEAKEMLKEIKGYNLLKGYRGQKGVNLKEVEKTLISLSDLIVKENLKEIDLNPVIANSKRAVAVDAKIII